MIHLKKILYFILCSSAVNVYGANEHFIEVDVALDALKYNAVVAFLYDSKFENGPGAVVFRPKANGSENIAYVRYVSGPSITLKQVSVKYNFLSYQDYFVNENCKNLDLASIDSRGLFIAMHINLNTQSISCTTTKIKEPI